MAPVFDCSPVMPVRTYAPLLTVEVTLAPRYLQCQGHQSGAIFTTRPNRHVVSHAAHTVHRTQLSRRTPFVAIDEVSLTQYVPAQSPHTGFHSVPVSTFRRVELATRRPMSVYRVGKTVQTSTLEGEGVGREVDPTPIDCGISSFE
eukprot:685493-Prorocentrum_minimum.AAC.2